MQALQPIDFRQLFEQSPQALLVLAPDEAFTILAVTDAYLRAGKLRREELVGRGLLEVFPGAQIVRAALERVVARRASEVIPVQKGDLSGPEERFEERYWTTTLAPLLSETGEVRFLLYRIGEAEAARAQLDAVFESFADAVYIGDSRGIVRANAAALAQLGYESVAELNRSVGTLAAEIQTRSADTGEVIPASGQAFTHALQGRRDIQEVLVRDVRTGEERVVRSSCAPIRVGGEVVGAVAVNTDITARKRGEAELRERAAFEQQLIGIVSHDLRNPLQGILLGTQSLLRRGGFDERTLRSLGNVLSAAQRASRLVSDLLDFTQARLGGGIPVKPRPVDLRELMPQVLEEIRASYPGRVLQLQEEGDTRGEWDPDRLAQVVSNLATNAVKYSPEDSPVTVAARGAGDEVVLEVHNRGEPIPPGLRARLFKPLQRGATGAETGAQGVGLGLYIVDALVRAHGGSVSVRSSRDEGTTFTVRLPRRAASPG